MKVTNKKGILINLDLDSSNYLRNLAEKNSSSMSQEVRRLIKDEERRRRKESLQSVQSNSGTN
jgi:hypothetical protein